MMFKAFLIVYAQALLIQCIAAQCIGSYNRLAAAPCAALGSYASAPGIAYPSPCGAALGNSQLGGLYGIGASSAAGLAASNGGGLPTSSASYFAPNGVSLVSENVYEGALEVLGTLPFLGTVALEGALPTAGAGAVAYGCGNGEVGILSEDISGAGIGALGYGVGALGYGVGALDYGAGALSYGTGSIGYGADALGYEAGLARLAYGCNGLANMGGRAPCGCNGRI